MKTILVVFTLLLFGSVSSATSIIEPATFTTTLHAVSGPARSITLKFTGDNESHSAISDTLQITHTGSGTFCSDLPVSTISFPEGTSETPFNFNCPGFQSLSTLTVVEIFEPDGITDSDGIIIQNTGAGPTRGSTGTFASAPTVAEPAGLAVVGTGLLILAGVLRRRARKGTPPATRQTLS